MRMKRTVEPKVLYFGTPVVLISSSNPDGTTNLAPMSSAWWLGYTAMLGMGTSAQTVKNLVERPEIVLNLVDPDMVAALDRIALLTGSEEMSESKQARGRPVIRLDRRVPRGAQLEVPRESLAPAEEDEYYVFQLIGLRVEEDGGDELGTVTDVVPGVANDVLQLDSGLALPMVEDCVREVDLATGRIVVAPGFSG